MSTVNLLGVLQDGSELRVGVPANPRTPVRMQKLSDWLVQFSAVTPGGAPVNLSVAVPTMLTVRKHPELTPIISRVGIPVGGQPVNRLNFSGAPIDTRDVEPGRYVYDVRGKFAGKWEVLMPPSDWLIEPSVGVPDQPLTAVSPVVFYFAFPPLIAAFDFAGAHVFEVGASLVNPSFTASYNRAATAASVTDGTNTVVLVSPFNGPAVLPFTYAFTAVNGQQDFTLTASEANGPNLTAVASAKWQPRVFYGSAVVPGGYTEAFIEGLASSVLLPSRVFSPGYSAGAGQRLFYCVPSSYGGSASDFIDHATGFAVGVTKVAAGVTVTNPFSVALPYDVWQSNQPGLGAITVDVM